MGSADGPPEVHQRSGCWDAVIRPRGVVILRHVTCRSVLEKKRGGGGEVGVLQASHDSGHAGQQVRTPNAQKAFAVRVSTATAFQYHVTSQQSIKITRNI